jgi:hypothetical protein
MLSGVSWIARRSRRGQTVHKLSGAGHLAGPTLQTRCPRSMAAPSYRSSPGSRRRLPEGYEAAALRVSAACWASGANAASSPLASEHRRSGPALSRSPAPGTMSGGQRREPEGSNGPDRPRQRARRNHLPARGTWVGPSHHERGRRPHRDRQASQGQPGDGSPEAQHKPVMAHADQQEANELERDVRLYPLTWRFVVERVTGIEPALSAWESDRSGR